VVVLVGMWWKKQMVGWGVLLVGESPLHGVLIATEVVWSLAPFFFRTGGIRCNLLCDSLTHYHEICNMEVGMCMGLGHGNSHDLVRRLLGCTG
jgi:hypothetical protein